MSAAPQQQTLAQQPQIMSNPQLGTGQAMGAPAPMAGPVRGVVPTPAGLERQQNLMAIKQLQQTLEAAQQKDIHLKALVFSVFPYV